MRYKQCLNGYWDFLPIYGDEPFEAALAQGGWIQNRYLVPSSWRSDEEVYNIFDYPPAWDQAQRGALRRTVDVEYTPGTRVFLRLDAAGQQCRVLANGVEIAASVDMFLPVEAELTSLLTQGDNRVELLVLCDQFPTVTRPDGQCKNLVPAGTWYARITRGIWQDAWLITRSERYITRCFVLTSVQDGTVSVTAELDHGDGCSVTGLVLDAEGKPVLALDETLSAAWPNARLWSPEDPYLYTLQLSLTRDGALLDVFSQRFGFREITVEGPYLYLNGVRINLRGDAWHYQGLVMQRKEYAENWYRMAKDQGINFIRPHGFPYPQCFFDAADECGMLLMAESGIYGSGKAMQADDPRFLKACEDHLRSWVQLYRNHPSVITWSMQNEMRWVEGREVYKEAIPALMDIVRQGDPSGRLVSCDGDNRLLTPEMMQAVSMHYNIDGRVADWDKTKPLLFGEHGTYHYVAPQSSSPMVGDEGYTSFWRAMEGSSLREAEFLRLARREDVTGVTPFNFVNYQLKAMPFEERRVDPGDVTAPGPHPCVIRPYSMPVNNGQLPDYPVYLPQDAIRVMRPVLAPTAILPEEDDTRFYQGGVLRRSFAVYNDTYRDVDVLADAVAEISSGRILLAQSQRFSQKAGERHLLNYSMELPELAADTTLTLRIRLHHGETLVREESFSYVLCRRPVGPVVQTDVVCLGTPGEVPDWIAPRTTYLHSPEELDGLRCQLLILGEALPYSQETLQPALERAAQEGRVGAILILRQTVFAPGKLVLSKRAFFAVHKCGTHPVTDGLTAADLRCWGEANFSEQDSDWMVSDAFDKPEDGGWRVLLDCGQGDFGWGGLCWCALLEGRVCGVPVLLTQLRLNEYLSKTPAAGALYAGCVRYLAAYQKPELISFRSMTPEELATRGADALESGAVVLVTGCQASHSALLSRLAGQEIRVIPDTAWQVRRVECGFTRGISNADLTGLEHTTYSAASFHNRTVAEYRLEYEHGQPVFLDTDAPWTEFFTQGMDAERVKVAFATRKANEPYTPRCYGLAVPAGRGTLLLSQLNGSFPGLRRAADTLAMNAGQAMETDLFRSVKKPMQHSIPQIMWLSVAPHWDYAAALAYHADRGFVLNNLGEGSYGWMQRVNAVDGVLTLPGSAGRGAFVTVFVDCALNHDPEKRASGEIPDPSIVPDLTVSCNTGFTVYINGRRFDGPATGGTAVLEDTLLEKGLNRVFFALTPGETDVTLSAVFRDKLGDYLRDARYLLTID